MRSRVRLAALLLLFFSHLLSAQSDTATLSMKAYLAGIVAENPLARNADLLLGQAEAQVRGARGAFDPKLYADWEQKAFGGSSYFTVGESGVKVKSQWGVEFKAGYQVARGSYLNPMNYLNGGNQSILGLTVPLLNGLTFDANRAGLRQSLLDREGLAADRRSQLNDLIYQSGSAYINWSVAYYQLKVTEQALQAALTRFNSIRESYVQGDKPGVDTLETYILYQTRLLDLNEAQLNIQNAVLGVQSLQWIGGRPALNDFQWRWRPESVYQSMPLAVLPVDSFMQQLDLINPDLRRLAIDAQQLQVERRLAVEQYKPRLDVSYNALGRGFNPNVPEGSKFPPNIFQSPLQNYKWGINFSFPLLLRKERGKVQAVEIKQQMVQNKLSQKRIDVENKVRNYYNQVENARRQVNLSLSIVNNTNGMLSAELRKFELGESSIFLINSREQKLFETQLKLIKTQGEFAKSVLAVYWAAGKLAGTF